MQKDGEDKGTPTEKVHTLEPVAYNNAANNNKPNIRTTFYDKQNGLWRQEEQF